jgi:hypothetical protein
MDTAPHISNIAPPFQPVVEVSPDYARLPVERAFNWSEAFRDVADGIWYLVVFRSIHRPDADHAYLTRLDERASRAASRYPGFMYYFIGTPAADGSCLSFCLWRTRADAIRAAADPEHQEAMVKGLPSFARYALERYQVVNQGGVPRIVPILMLNPFAEPHA